MGPEVGASEKLLELFGRQRSQHDLSECGAMCRTYGAGAVGQLEGPLSTRARQDNDGISQTHGEMRAFSVSRESSSRIGVARLTISTSSSALAASANSGRPIR